MKIIYTLLVLLSLTGIAEAKYIRGYYRGNGTYVQPHFRGKPDGYKWNNKSNSNSNWSTF